MNCFRFVKVFCRPPTNLLPILHAESCALSCWFCADGAYQEKKDIDSKTPLDSAACLHNDYTVQVAPRTES